jgi:hypothetical protein
MRKNLPLLWPLLGIVVGSGFGLAFTKLCPTEECPALKNAMAGALIGLVIGGLVALISGQWARLRLAKVKLTVPVLGELEFESSEAQREAGWRIFVEIATRVASQPLPQDRGLLGEAIASMHKLFDIVRTELKGMPPSPRTDRHTVEFLATHLLNACLRPFLAQWHASLETWLADKSHTEATWPDAAACREHLENTRKAVLEYAEQLGKLAGVSNPKRMLGDETGAEGAGPRT